MLAFILVPFALLGERITESTEAFVASKPAWWTAALVLGGLLAADVVLPIPSSFISTAAGALLGMAGGAITSWLGMSVGCLVGYWIGMRAGRPGARRAVGVKDLARVERAAKRWGDAVLLVFRATPVLAEASVVFAGMVRVPVGRFVALTSLSNLGISAVYAAIGAYAATVDAFVLAFLGAIVVPAIALVTMRVLGVSANR